MGLFGGIESDEPEVRSSFFKRLRTPKNATLVEPAPAGEPYLSKASKPAKPYPSFLGRTLAGDDIEDVESSTVQSTMIEPSLVEQATPRPATSEIRAEPGSGDFDRASVEQFAARTTAAHLAKHFGVRGHSIEAIAPASNAVPPTTSSASPLAAASISD